MPTPNPIIVLPITNVDEVGAIAMNKTPMMKLQLAINKQVFLPILSLIKSPIKAPTIAAKVAIVIRSSALTNWSSFITDCND